MLLRAAQLSTAVLFVISCAPIRAAVDYLRDVRPILSGHCFKCHGPDESTRKANLRLDVREEALKPAKSGARAIVPGDVSASELVKRILTSDEDDLMPPPAAKHPLTSAQKETLKEWVAEGAEYKPHWAFEKPKASPLPKVANASWPRNEIDHFILARLEQEGLKPSEPADKYTLARRLYLDLIGLPPTPEQADAFVNDNSPNAYERVVDSLLASPHYGERWARRWLDLARYADTNGYEKDRPRSMWPYRDWLIKALNDDMPFDQFTVEQIAGDLLPNATIEQKVATGFHRNTMINEEGGIDPLEYRFYAMVDRVHVTATTWLGLTMACAQCHTHKYDPIQHSEYYQFMAFMNNADEPKMEVPDFEITARRKEIETKIAKLQSELPNKFPPPTDVEWITPASPEFISTAGNSGELLLDGSIRVNPSSVPQKDSYTLRFKMSAPRVTHVQLEAIPDEKVGKGGPGLTDHGNFVLSEISIEVKDSEGTRTGKFIAAEADFSQDGFEPQRAFDGKDETGWAVNTKAEKRDYRRAIFRLAEPLVIGNGPEVTVVLQQNYGGKHLLGRFRVSVGNDRNFGLASTEASSKHLETKFSRWIERVGSALPEWKALQPAEAKSETPNLKVEEDGSVFASGDFTKNDIYKLRFSNVPDETRSIRLQVLPDERLPANGPGTVAYEGPEGDFFLSKVKVRSGGKEIKIASATQSFASGGNTADKAIDDDLQSGWSINGGQGREHSAVFQLAENVSGELEVDLICERYYAAGIGKFRMWASSDANAGAPDLPQDVQTALLQFRAEPSELLRNKLLREFVKVAPELESARADIKKLRESMPKFPSTLVMREWPEGSKRVTRRHHRGEFLQAKEEVQPGLPSFLPGLPEGAPRDRLGFARWLVSKENPLTGRVIMNRHWEAFFGRGLVRTLEDFGFQGELPSHAELLDWLAVDFPKRGWSQKEMHKLIVMSATYQQSSRVTPDLLERDPVNILLARGPRFRIEGEMVRDYALVASGLFSDKLGGPSVFPPQPAGVTTEGAYGPLQWKTSEGSDRYRRGLYTFAKRTAPYAMTATFDGPSGEACLARRDRSNTPLQALTLLNDEVFMEATRALGKWASGREGKSREERVAALVRRCLTRPPKGDELAKFNRFFAKQLERFKGGELKVSEFMNDESATAEQAAFAALARVLLNLDETISKS
ncbi:MAG TPA: PSD1 and planctomycete cytochrome C domain-containing protein [Verrucomicrobiae bacterium]